MKSPILALSHCSAFVGDKQILFDVSVAFQKGSVTVIMGPNGSGKSTLAHVVMGDKQFQITNEQLQMKKSNKKVGRTALFFDGNDITDLPTEERARLGIFLSFQSPVPIPGVSVMELIKTAYEEKKQHTQPSVRTIMTLIRTYAHTLHISEDLLVRSIHDGFSGGERKTIELLQAMVLEPKVAVFDEIDTGLDVDALRIIGQGIQALKRQGTTVIIITHNYKILSYVSSDTVVVMDKGKVAATGDTHLAHMIEEKGFKNVLRM